MVIEELMYISASRSTGQAIQRPYFCKTVMVSLLILRERSSLHRCVRTVEYLLFYEGRWGESISYLSRNPMGEVPR